MAGVVFVVLDETLDAVVVVVDVVLDETSLSELSILKRMATSGFYL